MFMLRTMATNYYLHQPILGLDATYSEFRGATIKQVPVLQILGYTEAGQKACLHIHGAFPYLHVPYDGTQPDENYLKKFAASLEEALNISTESTEPDVQQVYKILIVPGKCIGLTSTAQLLKIFLYNPANVSRAAALLLEGKVMNKPYQPYEPHIPYPLQVINDYNFLDGNSISIAAFKVRNSARGDKNDEKMVHNSIVDSEPKFISVPLKLQQNLPTALETPALTALYPVSTTCSGFIVHDGHSLRPCSCSEHLDPAGSETWSSCCLDFDVVVTDIMRGCDISEKIASPYLQGKHSSMQQEFFKNESEIRLVCAIAELKNIHKPDGDGDCFMLSDFDDDTNDDFDQLPQYDGASDKMAGSQKNTNQNQIPTTVNPNTSSIQAPDYTLKVQAAGGDPATATSAEMGWRAGPVGRGSGSSSQGYPPGNGSPWTQQAWQNQSGRDSGSWHGQASWVPMQQQQQYQNWPPHQQQMPSAFPSQQAPFRSPSPANSFQSPPHNPYTSPTHQQSYQAPSPSHHHYQYPSYQSPPSNQPYQQSSQHTFHPQGASQPFQTPQPYQSTASSQSYSSHGSMNQPYQAQTSSKLYQSPTGNQPYQSPPTTSRQFQSPHGAYHSAGAQGYPSYQSPPHCQQPPQTQPYSHPYQSPAQDGCYPAQPSWGSQGYSGFYQGLMTNERPGAQNISGKPSSENSQPGMSSGPSINPSPAGPSSFAHSPCMHQQETAPNKPPNTQAELQPSQFAIPQFQQEKVDKSGKEPIKPDDVKPAQFSSTNQLAVAASKSCTDLKSSPATSSPLSSGILLGSQNNSSPHDHSVDKKPTLLDQATEFTPPTKISTLEFKLIASGSSTMTNKESCTSKSTELLNSETRADAKKIETSTPMIQQLLMEEPIRMNIKKEDRDAVMKKPVANPTLPKPKRKYKSRGSQGAKPPGRPRSTSLSSPVPPPFVGYCGFSPQPMMSPSMIGRPGRSHSISLPFSCDARMPSPMQNYGWQQWKQQSFPPGDQWQEQQQHQSHWPTNEWQSFDNTGESNYSFGDMDGCSELGSSRLQHRSFSVEDIPSPIYQQNPSQTTPFSNSQIASQSMSPPVLKTSANSAYECSSVGSVSNKSSLSNLFQLVSDVGSEDSSWENSSVSVVPSLFLSSNDSETTQPVDIPEMNQGSPPVKDFITLETPSKQEGERTSSDTTGLTCSEESDHMELDFTSDLFPRAISRSHSVGSFLPRVGKQSRMKKLGMLQNRSIDLGSASGPVEPNPAYTYTFHVPTTTFKKLKFYRNADTREQRIQVVRMHPMDARKYSLLKIGREIVKAMKLSQADLETYNISPPLPSCFVTSDGSSNRVNLDIPTVSMDKLSGDGSAEENSLSKFDTDFPPNKVAPPSSFHASQASTNLSRASSTTTRSSPHNSDWMRPGTGHQSENYNGGFSPGSHKPYSPKQGNFSYTHQQAERALPTYTVPRHIARASSNSSFGSQTPEDTSSIPFHPIGQKRNGPYPHSAPSSISDQNSYYTHQQSMNSSPYPQQQHYFQQQYYQQQVVQQQVGSSGSHTEPKNGLRSPGQHGQTSRIDSGRINGHRGDDQDFEQEETTTEISHINPRVNARRWNNHAEYMAKYAATHQVNMCSSSDESVFEQTQTNCRIENCKKHTDHEMMYNEQTNNIVEICKEKESCKEKAQPVKMLGGNFYVHNLVDVDEADAIQNDLEVGGVANNKISLDVNEEIAPSKSEHLNKSAKYSDSFVSEHNRRKNLLSRRRNIKSLSLKMPNQQPDLYSQNSELLCGSSNYTERDSAASSQKESDYDEDEERRNSFPIRRSTRFSRLEELRPEGRSRNIPRQAKLRSIYSRNLNGKKPKKKRKRQENQVEGVHYIVVGKFKGHQAMLVKVEKVTVNPADTVNAELYEKLAAKEIVRRVSSIAFDEEFLRSTTESQSDAETPLSHLDCKNLNYSQQSTPRSRMPQRAWRGRPLRSLRFRSAQVSSTNGKSEEINSSLEKSENKTRPKNLLTGPRRGARENNVPCTFFSQDNFFFKFKEHFMKHNRLKEHPAETEPDHDNTFFEGIKKSKFHNFQQRFIANVQKLKTGDYSSSSDDEDDILDEVVLKERLRASQLLKLYLRKGTSGPHDSNKNEYIFDGNGYRMGSIATSSTADMHPTAHKKKSTFDSPNKDKDDLQNMWLPLRSSFYATKCYASGLYNDTMLSHNGITYNSLPCKNKTEVDSGKRPCKETDRQHGIGPTVPLCNVGPSWKTQSPAENSSQQIQFDNLTPYSVGESNSPGNLTPCFVQEPNRTCSSIKESTSTGNSALCLVREPNSIGNSIVCSARESVGDEQNEDYLKCQMAFFEDISSDSDSNDTIIIDSYTGRDAVLQRDPILYAPFTTARTDKPIAGTVGQDNVTRFKNNADLIGKVSTEGSKVSTYEIAVAYELREHREVLRPDSRFLRTENSISENNKPQKCMNESEHGLTSHTVDFVTNLSQNMNIGSLSLRDEQKDFSYALENNMLVSKDISSATEISLALPTTEVISPVLPVTEVISPILPVTEVISPVLPVTEVISPVLPVTEAISPVLLVTEDISSILPVTEDISPILYASKDTSSTLKVTKEILPITKNILPILDVSKGSSPILNDTKETSPILKNTKGILPTTEDISSILDVTKDTSFISPALEVSLKLPTPEADDSPATNMSVSLPTTEVISPILPVAEDIPLASEITAVESSIKQPALSDMPIKIAQDDKGIADESLDPDDNLGTRTLMENSHTQKMHGKKKRSKRNRSSKLVNRRQQMGEGNSSSDDEADNLLKSSAFIQNKRLRQRKQPQQIFYSEELDATEGEDCDLSDFEFVTHKSSKTFRKLKGREAKTKYIRKPPETPVEIEKPTRGSQKARPARGRRKKSLGGDKLLSSLSLLHMATIANLTETQSDPVDDHSMSETAFMVEDCSLQCSDLSSRGHNSMISLAQDQTCFKSSFSDEIDVSSTHSLSSKKNKFSRRGRYTGEDTVLSRRLLNLSRRQASLKPGCNGASNMGSKPLPISRLVSNSTSSSPIPSNFFFSHASDSSSHFEPSEDTGSNNTLQLLETRRAQVNCASFSMKDILKLTTGDDSMDSDSRDSAAPIRPPESRKAQVKNAVLSMTDLLKLNSVNRTSETWQPHAISPFQVPDSDHCKSQPYNKTEELLNSQRSFSDLEKIQEVVLPSDLKRMDSVVSISEKQDDVLEGPCPSAMTGNHVEPAVETTKISLLCLADMHNSGACEAKGSAEDSELALSLARCKTSERVHDHEKTALMKQPPPFVNGLLSANSNSGGSEAIVNCYEETKCLQGDELPEDGSADESSCVGESTGLDKRGPDHCSSSTSPFPTSLLSDGSNVKGLTESPSSQTFLTATPVISADKISSPQVIVPATQNAQQHQNNACTETLNDLDNLDSSPARENSGPSQFATLEDSVKLNRLIITSTTENGIFLNRTAGPQEAVESNNTNQPASCFNEREADLCKPVPSQAVENLKDLEMSPFTLMGDNLDNMDKAMTSLAIVNQKQFPNISAESLSKSLSNSVIKNFEASTSTSTTETIPGEKEVINSSVIHQQRFSKSDAIPDKTTSNENYSQKSTLQGDALHAVEIPKISITPYENDEIDSSNSKPSPGKSKQENKKHCKNLNVRNAERGMKPLHPLQIPPYPSYMNQGNKSQPERTDHSRSMYYPYCWKWPIHNPELHPNTSPLNLCTTQKSPNSYSPITPTSPASPSYPTPAQGPASDLSPPSKKAKPLWYPWLTVDSIRSENRVCSISSTDGSRHNYKMQTEKNSRTPDSFVGNPNDQGQSVCNTSDSICSVLAQTQHWRGKHDTGILSELQKLSTKTPADQSKSHTTNSSLTSYQAVSQILRMAMETPFELKYTDISSTNFSGENLKIPYETSNAVTPNTKQGSGYRNSVRHSGVLDSPFWNGDNAVTPDSLDSYPSECSGYNSLCSKYNERKSVSERAENRNGPCSNGFLSADILKNEDRQGMLKHKNRRKQKKRFGLSSPLNSALRNRFSEPESITHRLVTKLIKGDVLGNSHRDQATSGNVGGSKGIKQPSCSQKTCSSVTFSRSNLSEDLPAVKQEQISEKSISSQDDKLTCEGKQDQPVVKSPLGRSSLEESLHMLGLQAQQSSIAICTNLQDIPEKSIYLQSLCSPLHST